MLTMTISGPPEETKEITEQLFSTLLRADRLPIPYVNIDKTSSFVSFSINMGSINAKSNEGLVRITE